MASSRPATRGPRPHPGHPGQLRLPARHRLRDPRPLQRNPETSRLTRLAKPTSVQTVVNGPLRNVTVDSFAMWLKVMLTNAEVGTSAVAAARGALLGGIIADPLGGVCAGLRPLLEPLISGVWAELERALRRHRRLWSRGR